ncbi:MAG: hypothetical protein SNJ75_04245 [Gemmataceae bacterium]
MFRLILTLLPAGLLGTLLLMPPVAVQSNPALVAVAPAAKRVALWAAREVGRILIGHSLEKLFGSEVKAPERITELQRRLEMYESMLLQVDAKQANEIAKLRRSLNEKTTAEDVRRIVEATLASLDEKLRDLEGRLGEADQRMLTLEKRVQAIEDLFGRISYFPPTPLLVRASDPDGKPQPHPHIKEWISLLCQSEESRIRLLQLRRDFEDRAEVVQNALAEDKKIVAATQALHRKALEEMANALNAEEIRLLKPGTPKRLPAEEKIAGLMWLIAVTRPIPEGPYQGRIGVPPALFGSQACEIVEACDLSGVKPEQLVTLLRRGLTGTLSASTRYFADKPATALAEPFQKTGSDWLGLGNQLQKALRRTREIDERGQRLLKEFGQQHEKMQELNKEKQQQISKWRDLAKQLDVLLNEALQVYLQAIRKGERPTNSAMRTYRDEVLLPMLAWQKLLETADSEWKDRVLVETTWDRLLTSIPLPYVGVLRGHTEGVTGLVFHPQGQLLLSSSFDKSVVLWDLASGTKLKTFAQGESEVRAIAFDRTGERFVSGALDGTTEVWSTDTGKRLFMTRKHKKSILSIAFHPTQDTLLSGSDEEPAYLYDLDGKLLHTFSGRSTLGYLAGYKDQMRSVAISPEGKYLLTGNGYQRIYLWDAQTGKKLLELNSHDDTILAVAFRPDGRQFLTASADGTVKIWSITDGKLLHTLEGHEGAVYSAVFSPDGRRILSGGNDGTVRLWEAESGKPLQTFKGHTDRILSVAFHPLGKRFASAGLDKTIRIWELLD